MMFGRLTKSIFNRGLGIQLFEFQFKSGITTYAKVERSFYKDLFKTPNFRNRIVFQNDYNKKRVVQTNINETSLSSMSSKEFINVLQNVFLDNYKSNDVGLRNLLKKECFNRQPDFDNVSTFYCADIFMKSEFFFDDYINAISRTLMFKWDDLIVTKTDALLLAYFLSTSKVNKMLPVMDKIETYLRENISSMTAREVGLFCHLFFTTNNRIKEYGTMEALKSYILSNLSKKSVFYLSDLNNMIKVLRHAHYANVPFFMEMGDMVCTDTLNDSCTFTHLSNMAFTYGSLYIKHDNLLNKIAEIFCKKIQNPEPSSSDGVQKHQHAARLKDFSRLLWSLASLGLEVPEILKTETIDLIRSDPDHAFKYPEIFIESLVALASSGTYDSVILNLAFSRNFIKYKRGRQLEQDYQLLLLNTASKIEGGIDFKHDSETKEYLQSLIPDKSERLRNDLTARQGFSATVHAIHKLLGDWSLFKVHNIFDFSTISDIELLVTKTGKPSKAWKEESKEMEKLLPLIKPKQEVRQGSILEQLLKEELNGSQSETKYEPIHLKQDSPSFPKKLCIKIFGRNQYAKNSPTLNGQHKLELRLLHKSGYEVYVIDPHTAEHLDSVSEEERIKVLSEILIKCGVTVNKKLLK